MDIKVTSRNVIQVSVDGVISEFEYDSDAYTQNQQALIAITTALELAEGNRIECLTISSRYVFRLLKGGDYHKNLELVETLLETYRSNRPERVKRFRASKVKNMR